MADYSPLEPTKTPISDAVLRVVARQLRRMELMGALTPSFEVRVVKDGQRVKHCNILLLGQDFAVIPEN